MAATTLLEVQASALSEERLTPQTAFGCPRLFLENQFVYLLWCARARGLTVGVTLSPDRRCNFECVYCEVNHSVPPRNGTLDIDVMAGELRHTLEVLHSGRLAGLPSFRAVPPELLQFRQVTISGDGEPTMCACFYEAVQAIIHVRAQGRWPFFKLALITNGTGLDHTAVQRGLRYFTQQDEVWVKLDAGTQAYMDKVNQPHCTLRRVLGNIRVLGQQRPVVIQSLFCLINGEEPPEAEIEEYIQRLLELTREGTQIALVQIYSATRPPLRPGCGHLRLKSLSQIAQRVRHSTGLTVEVF